MESTDPSDICVVYGVVGGFFVGEYIYGIAIQNIRFPRTSTRLLTEEDKKEYDGKGMYLNEVCLGQINT